MLLDFDVAQTVSLRVEKSRTLILLNTIPREAIRKLTVCLTVTPRVDLFAQSTPSLRKNDLAPEGWYTRLA